MSGVSFELSVNGSLEKAAQVLEVEAPYVHECFTLYRCATHKVQAPYLNILVMR